MGSSREKMEKAKNLLSEVQADANVPLEDTLQRIQTRLEFAIRTHTTEEDEDDK